MIAFNLEVIRFEREAVAFASQVIPPNLEAIGSGAEVIAFESQVITVSL